MATLHFDDFILIDNTTYLGDIEDDIQKALERPADFGYYGERDLFETWCITFSTHRDDDVAGKANWDVMLEQLNERFGKAGEKWEVMHASHWAVGWADQIILPVVEVVAIDDFGDAVYAVTEQFAWALEIKGALEEYPLLDETRYSEMEYDEMIDYIKQASSVNDIEYDGKEYEVIDALPDDYAEKIAQWLSEHRDSMRVDDVSDDDLNAAMVNLGMATEVKED